MHHYQDKIYSLNFLTNAFVSISFGEIPTTHILTHTFQQILFDRLKFT